MTFIRQNIGPLVILLIFLFALVATSARIFLPTDMSGPAPLTGVILTNITALISAHYQ